MIPEILEKKIFLSQSAFSGQLSHLRQMQHRIVFTNGCFDLLHPGHIHCLFEAKSKGDYLIVGLNTDSSVTKLKGHDRPVKSQLSRAIILSSVSCVDAVILFDQKTPKKLIEWVRPHVLVKGDDYELSEIIGADFVLKYGGEVVRVPLLKGFSSTKYVNKIQ